MTEHVRLSEDKTRVKNWKRWGPYLSERQWATVREDYSPNGEWCVILSHIYTYKESVLELLASCIHRHTMGVDML